MDHSTLALALTFLTAIVCHVYSEEMNHVSALNTLEDHQETHQPQKRSPASSPALYSEDLEADSGLEEPMDDMDKKNTLFRFGKRQGAWFRYGKRAGTLLRFGKRGTLLRFGKRGGSLLRFGRGGNSDADFSEDDKRTLFRFGKRSDLEEIVRDALAREELSNSPWYMENEPVKRGVNGFHWGQESEN
ncbi:antho-RFamide neuropeptides-like [Biomphalaria glabrata]|uniref:Antho-RFamide neuropeptides-like n=1 Tax=Biomphalaria glabrata TaxID=6526 RepID=A0A9U8E1B8_BIOGL|nr:antho-RFamide neuropeptides-like [Biomphalaria glabrata]